MDGFSVELRGRRYCTTGCCLVSSRGALTMWVACFNSAGVLGATFEVFSTRKILGRLGRWGVLLAGGADRRCHRVTGSQGHSVTEPLGAWRGTRAFHASFLTYCTLYETRFESLGGLRQYEVLGRHPTREAPTLPLVKQSIDGGQTSG